MALLAAGYTAPRLEEIRTDLRADVRTGINAVNPGAGDTVNLDAGTLIGNLIDIFAARLDEISESTQDLYDSFDERAAIGVYLDSLASLVGVTRIAARASVVTLTLASAVGATVPAGSIASDAAGVQWITATAGVIAPAGTIDVEASPASTGAIAGAAGTITTIDTPVTNWDSVTNAADATVGRDRETDSELRIRRREDLQVSGAASPNSIRARVTAVAGIDQALVVDNKTDADVTIDTVTLTPHTFAVVVAPTGIAASVQALVLDAIWDTAPAGIDSIGSTSGTVTDVEGTAQTVRFSEATAQVLTVAIELTVTAADYGGAAGGAGAGDTATEDALVAYVATLGIGDTPLDLPTYEAVGAVPGVDNITTLTWAGAVSEFEIGTLIAGGITITPTP